MYSLSGPVWVAPWQGASHKTDSSCRQPCRVGGFLVTQDGLVIFVVTTPRTVVDKSCGHHQWWLNYLEWLGIKLATIELGIQTTPVYEDSMGALFDDPAFGKNDQPICPSHGAQPVSDDHGGAVVHQHLQR